MVIKNNYNNYLLSQNIPNSIPRNEFLIVLEYLYNVADSKDNAATQQKIIEYALSNYDIEIRRDRIAQILLHIEYLVNRYPDKFPFKINKITTQKGNRYYIEEKFFSEEELVDIISSLKNNPLLNEESEKALTKKLLSAFSSSSNIESIKKKVIKHHIYVDKVSKVESKLLEKLIDASVNKKRIWFTLNDGIEYTGFIPRINYPNAGDLVIYIDKEENVIETNISKIRLTKEPLDISDWIDDVNFYVVNEFTKYQKMPLKNYLDRYKLYPFCTNITMYYETK